MDLDGYEAPTYPALKLLVRYGRKVAAALAGLGLLGAVAVAVAGHWGMAAGLVLAAPVAAFLLVCFVEIAEIVSDTLMPR